MKIPQIGIVICNSGASNTGYLTGVSTFKVVRELGEVGICSLPSLANRIPRQIMLIKQIKHSVVIYGCHQKCAKKILDEIGIKYDEYMNLEENLGYKKLGPFTTFESTEEDVEKIFSAIFEKITFILDKQGGIE